MARRRYDLIFAIDSTRAESAARRVVRQLENAEAAAKRAGTAMESAYNRAATAANNAASKMAAVASRMPAAGVGGAAGAGGASAHARNAVQIAAIEDRYLKADYDRRVRAEARKQQAADAAAARAAQQASQQAAQIAAIEDRYLQRDYAQRVSYERRKISQKEREVRQLAQIEDRYLRDEYRRRVAFQARQAADQEAATAAAVAKSGQILKSGLVVATGAALAGLKLFVDGYAKIREDAERAAAASLGLRKTLREEAILKGAYQTTNKELVESLQFRAQTGLGEYEATEFTRQYLGSVPIARQKGTITPQVESDLMRQAGIMAARQGGDAGTRGELAGLLGQFGKVESASAGMAQLEAIRVALTEGRGDDTPLTQQLLKAAGSMVREGGAVGTLPELAALIGVTSLSAGPEEAATRAQQLARGLRAGLTKMRGGAGTKMPQGKYLASLGIGEKDTLETALDKIVPDMRTAKASGRQLEAYLAEHGFRGDEERKALIEVEPIFEQLKQRLAAARQAGAGRDAQTANQRYLASPEGRLAVGEALNRAAEITRGISEERSKSLLAEAAASPEFQRSEASMSGYLGNIGTGLMSGHFWSPGERGRRLRLEEIASGILGGRARMAGVDQLELEQAAVNYRAGGGDFPGYVNEVEGLIRRAGGSTAADIRPVLERLTKVIEENTRITGENNKRMGAPPPVAPPAPPPLGPRP